MCNLAPYSIACVVTAAGGWNHHRQAARHLDLILPVLARLAWARHGLATFASHVSWWGTRLYLAASAGAGLARCVRYVTRDGVA